MVEQRIGLEHPHAQPPLFSQVFFRIIVSPELSHETSDDLRIILEQNGAELHSYTPDDGNSNLEGLTHIVSETINFEGYEKAIDLMIPVVKPTWVTDSANRGRLANPRAHSPDPRLFFSGLVVCTANIPEGDKDAIIGGVIAMGGLYSGSVSRMITHMVALSMDPPVCQLAVAKRLECKIVLPHWFDDCLRLGRRINEGPYLLPDPEILRKGPYSGIKAIPRPDLQIDILPNIKSTMDISNSFPERSSVFRDLKVLLSEDLGVSELHRETMETLVYRGGGCCTSELEEADILVCQYRDSSAFRLFASQSKTVGNLSWLYHVISQDSWSNPMRRLLHFPIARDGLPGFKDFRISLSNYNGEARVYLENLAKAAGCEFTKTMKIENTHLITAHLKSEKCEAAKEWNINIVNHLWLEESYAKWQVQSLANPRFTHFPPRTNLGEVVGQTPVDKKALECFFHPKSTKVTSRNGYNRKPVSGPERGRNAAKMAREGQCEEAATPSKTRVLPTHNPKGGSSGTSYGGNVEEKGVTSAQGSAAQTPSSAQDEARGKENETPPTGTRSAKERAAARLHNMSSDIALYEKERKRVGGVLFGGKKSEEDLVSSRSLKRPASAKSLRDDASSPAERQSKRPKKTKTTPLVKLLVTGYAKWAEDSRSFEKDRDRLRKLGIVLKDGYADCDLVAAPKIMRTRKFICAMANGSILISTDFVEQCLIQNKLLDPEDYPLKDPDGEERFNMTLSEALARAKENNGQLLEGQVIYATENVHGGFDTYKAIVEANGGSCILFKGRAGLKVPKLKETNSQPDQQFIYLISAPEGSDLKLWPKFQEIADEAQRVARIVKTEWMLDLALSQQLHWNLGYSFLPNET